MTLSGRGHSVIAEDNSCDLVIMNLPFTRPTNRGAGHAGIPDPSFAGLSTSHDEQRAMGRKLKNVTGLFGHGNAGLASNFMAPVHRRPMDGGVVALTIPVALARCRAWANDREALLTRYSDIHVTSIAATRSTAREFSTYTGMAEWLVAATKGDEGKSSTAHSRIEARRSSLLKVAIEAKNARDRAE